MAMPNPNAYRGAETMVQLRADYMGSVVALKETDYDSMFAKASYDVPDNITRSWGCEEVRTGEGHKRLNGPVRHVVLNIGYMPDFTNPDGAYLGAPDNKSAGQTVADCFTRDLMVSVRAAIEKYNAAIGEMAEEAKFPIHVGLHVKSTIKDAPGASTWQNAEASLKVGKDSQEAAAHCSRHPCKATVIVEHGEGCSYKKRRQSAADVPGAYAETDIEGPTALRPGHIAVVPGKGHVRVKGGRKNSTSPDL